ncbi:hypothetical protein [Deinococcus misasensis]|uniref:hypothetical protein n=1 Tax=Deinococcus misasensis TaxID=392413 RepID=UPI000A7298E0|nr:hypothetical protein [Deinococcus misasensis]
MLDVPENLSDHGMKHTFDQDANSLCTSLHALLHDPAALQLQANTTYTLQLEALQHGFLVLPQLTLSGAVLPEAVFREWVLLVLEQAQDENEPTGFLLDHKSQADLTGYFHRIACVVHPEGLVSISNNHMQDVYSLPIEDFLKQFSPWVTATHSVVPLKGGEPHASEGDSTAPPADRVLA